MSKNKKWYKRTHDFAPYTRADGQAVSDEFDAIQASFERIPAMRDDGLGFEVSPVIPDGTEDNHPISMRQLREGEQSVLQMKNAVTEEARQVAENTRTTATNTQTAVDAKEQAVSSAQQSANAAQTATEKAQQAHQAKESIHGVEERVNALKQATETTAQQVSADALLARRWASRPEGRPVEGTLHSARHYAIQAQRSAQAAANTETRLNAAASSVEGKIDKTAISDSVSSNSRTHVGSSFAVKTAYDKAVDALDVANSKLGSIGTYTGNTSSLYGQNIIFDVRDNNNLGLPPEAYPWGVGLSLSSSNGGKALLYIAHNSSQVWAKGVYGTDDSQPWRRIDGTDWGTIRNPVYASTTLRGLAQYSDDINLDSSEFAASSKAVKLLNDKKVDKLIEQTLDLTHLNSDHWYPVMLQMPSSRRRTYRFVVRTTLGESSATWGTHSAGFGVYLEWEAQPSGWGTWQGYDQMRVVHQFEVSHANQSPILKMGQLYEISGEYLHLRGGARYTLYREEGIVVTLTGTDYRWEQQVGNHVYRRHLPVITRYDESLVPKTYRQGLVQESEFTSFKQLLIGIPFPYPLDTVPENCLAFYGQVFDKQRYPVLAQRYPTGRLPDLRGEFIRGWDNGRGIDAQRVLLSAQDDQFKAHQHFVETISSRGWGSGSSDGYGSSSDQYYSQHNATSVEGDDETRPRNIAFHYICLAG